MVMPIFRCREFRRSLGIVDLWGGGGWDHSSNHESVMKRISLFLLVSAVAASAQTYFGDFVIHPNRGQEGHRFTYWESFTQAYQAPNFARPDSADTEGNVSNYNDNVTITQTEQVGAFITGSGSIYSHGGATTFKIEYFHDGAEPLTGIVCQFQTGGTTIDLRLVSLFYQSVSSKGEPITVTLPGKYHAFHQPGEGGFTDRTASGVEWIFTPEDPPVKDFVIHLESPDISMPIYQAQLDVIAEADYAGTLGYLLSVDQKPQPRYGKPLMIEGSNPETGESRFFRPGETAQLTVAPSDPDKFVFVGWADPLGTTEMAVDHLFEDADYAATALYAPLSYEAWRETMFHHILTTGEDADDLDDAISGPFADHDGDGFINQLEYAFGGDPYHSDGGLLTPEIAQQEDGTLTITHRRWKLPPDQQRVAYLPEYSLDLQEWHRAEEVTLISDFQDDQDGTETVAISLPAASDHAARYYRLNITLPEN